MAQSEGIARTPPCHKQYVRSFLFSVKIDSPLARLHMLTKFVSVLALSLVIVRFLSTDAPDPLGALLLIVLAFFGLYLSGVLRWVFRSYLLVLFPSLIAMMITWVVFNPDPGRGVLARITLYNGQIPVGISLGLVVFIVFAVGWFIVRREVFYGVVGGLILASALTFLVGNPSITFARLSFFHPLTIILSEKNIALAISKALGYGAMIFVSLMLVMTSRDVEFTGAMIQLRIPYVASFFISTMLRSLSMALNDYSTIRQAQVARGVTLQKKNILQIIVDLAYIAVPLTATMLRRSREVGDAILLRGFSLQTKSPTEFHEVRPFTRADFLVLALCAFFVIAVLVFGLNITQLLGFAI